MTLEQHPWQSSLGASGPALYASARPEGSPAEERASNAAAATLERLRAQNRRHQANHRARVKRKILDLERKIESVQQLLSDAKQRYSELRSIRQELETAVQQNARRDACSNGRNGQNGHSSPQSSHMNANSSASTTYGVANTLTLTSRLPEQVAALATAWGMHSSPTSSGALSHSILQQHRQTSPADTVHSAQAPQTPNSIACSLLAQLSSSGSRSSSGAGGGGDATASVHQRRHPQHSTSVQGASSPLPGHLRDPVRCSMTLPEFPPRVPSATGVGSSMLTAPIPPLPQYHLLPDPHAAQMSASPAPLLDHFSMHALNAPVELPMVSSGRPPPSLWGTVRAPPHNTHKPNSGEPDLLSAPLDTDPLSLAEVLSQCRSASESDPATSATNANTPTSHMPSVFPVRTNSAPLHVNPFLRGAASSPLEFATIQASASIVQASMGTGIPLSPLHNAHAQSAFLPHHFMEHSHQQPHLQSAPALTYPQTHQHSDLQYSAGIRVSHSTPNIRAQWHRQHERSL